MTELQQLTTALEAAVKTEVKARAALEDAESARFDRRLTRDAYNAVYAVWRRALIVRQGAEVRLAAWHRMNRLELAGCPNELEAHGPGRAAMAEKLVHLPMAIAVTL